VDTPTTRQPSVRDGLIRTVLIPVFGIAIPLVTDLYGPIHPLTQMWWMGQAWFLLTSFTIYHGNRWLLFRHRRRFSWIDRPMQKLLVLVGANVFFYGTHDGALLEYLVYLNWLATATRKYNSYDRPG